MDVFKGIIIIQLFYAVAISLIAHAMPAGALDYVTGFSDAGTQIDVEGVASDVQSSLESQTDIPVIELGALVFYSGNILIDLLINFDSHRSKRLMTSRKGQTDLRRSIICLFK